MVTNNSSECKPKVACCKHGYPGGYCDKCQKEIKRACLADNNEIVLWSINGEYYGVFDYELE